MSFSGGSYVVASNLLLSLSVVWLIYARLDSRYHYQIATLLTSMLASFSYHLCWTNDLAWCAAGGSSAPAAVAMARDIMSAFQAMGIASILVDQWWLGRHGSHHSPRLFAWFCILSTLGTWVMVVLYGDGNQTIATTSILWGLVVFYALLHDRMAEDASVWRWWTWTRFVLGVVFLAGAAGLRSASIQQYDLTLGVDQSDTYDAMHGSTHAAWGLGALCFVSMVSGREAHPTQTHDQTKKPLVGKSASRA